MSLLLRLEHFIINFYWIAKICKTKQCFVTHFLKFHFGVEKTFSLSSCSFFLPWRCFIWNCFFSDISKIRDFTVVLLKHWVFETHKIFATKIHISALKPELFISQHSPEMWTFLWLFFGCLVEQLCPACSFLGICHCTCFWFWYMALSLFCEQFLQ